MTTITKALERIERSDTNGLSCAKKLEAEVASNIARLQQDMKLAMRTVDKASRAIARAARKTNRALKKVQRER